MDVLVLDLPPGTGDIQLTIVQTVSLDGALIVTTPQEVALVDARKAIAMFRKVNVEILGLVENMSYFVVPGTEEKHEIFGSGEESGKRRGRRFRCWERYRWIQRRESAGMKESQCYWCERAPLLRWGSSI